MDINDIRSIVTVLGLIAFVGIWIWAWSRRRQREFDEAARLPFTGEDNPAERPDDKTRDSKEKRS